MNAHWYSLIILLFVHYLGDFALQQGWMAERKRKDPWVFLAHCVIWTGLIVICLDFFGLLEWWKIGFLFGGHLLCDLVKPKFGNQKDNIDQLFHILQILIVWAL